MRKVFILFVCLLIPFYALVDVTAAEIDEETSPIETTFPFDYIRYNNGTNIGQIVPFAYNAISSSPDLYQFEISTSYYAGFADFDNVNIRQESGISQVVDVINSSHVFAGATNVTLHSDLVLYYRSWLRFGSDEGNLKFRSISVTGNLVTIDSNGFTYAGKSIPFEYRTGLNSATFIDFPPVFAQIAKELGYSVTSVSLTDYIITDLNITIDFYFDSVDPSANQFFQIYTRTQFDGFSFPAWVGALDLPVPDGNVDFIKPLLGGAESFFDFQIAPGITPARIFYVVLIICFILWFVTLII